MVNKSHSFEFEGVTITNRLKSPCGRFDLSEEESSKLYGPIMPDGFELNTQLGGNCSGWEKAYFNKLDARILITCEDGANAPESFPVLVGIYTEDTEEYFECSTQKELQQIIDKYSTGTTI
tara:strand:- start:291 stop:653 length:363 start_codon:yes stop_codon:yes gene_type:complete